jgi:hypothetical protein
MKIEKDQVSVDEFLQSFVAGNNVVAEADTVDLDEKIPAVNYKDLENSHLRGLKHVQKIRKQNYPNNQLKLYVDKAKKHALSSMISINMILKIMEKDIQISEIISSKLIADLGVHLDLMLYWQSVASEINAEI